MNQKILSLFLYNERLTFGEIKKLITIRSNKLAYHLKKLTKEKILKKEEKFYSLSEEYEYLIPYLDSRTSVLPVILISLSKNKKIFFHKRQKKPYKDKFSLPGGRLILGENIKEAVKRIMKKYEINASLKEINSISLEQVRKKGKIIHTFLLILVSAKTDDEVEYMEIKKNKSKIIPSDYNLIKKDLNKKMQIKEIFSKA